MRHPHVRLLESTPLPPPQQKALMKVFCAGNARKNMFIGFHRVEVFGSILEFRVRCDGEPCDGSMEPTGGADIVVDVVRAPGWQNSADAFGVHSERDAAGVRRIVVERPFVSGALWATPRGFEGAFTIGGEPDALLEGLMSFALSALCEVRGDLLLHASAVMRGDRALLFLGDGGAGKTTIATELNGDRETFCVDKALVTTRPDGVLRVHSTPFGDGFDGPRRPESAAVAGLFFIEQAEENEVVPLSRWEATNLLVRQTLAESRDLDLVQRTMNTIGRLADLDVSFRLRFKKDAGFWPLVDGVLSKG